MTVPKHLSKAGQHLWMELQQEYNIDDKAGLLLLTTACEAFDRMKQAADIIKKKACSYPTVSVNSRPILAQLSSVIPERR